MRMKKKSKKIGEYIFIEKDELVDYSIETISNIVL